MKRLISFGSFLFPANTFAFPDTQTSLSDNFTNIVTRTVRLPGMSGGFDELGFGEAPREIGNLRTSFMLRAATPAALLTLRDTVRGFPYYGPGKLVFQPIDPAATPRYCFARAQVDVSEDAKYERPDARCSINFHVPDPFWYQDADATAAVWSVGQWGTAKWGGSYPTFNLGSAHAVSGTTWGTAIWGSAIWSAYRDVTLTNNGNTWAIPRLIFTCTEACPGGISIENRGSQIDLLSYSGAIATGQILNIDCRAMSVRLNGVDAYTTSFDHIHPNFLRQLPGLNTLRVTLPGGGGGTLRVIYAHTWS